MLPADRLRRLVCEQLSKEAPGVSYRASMIADLRVIDPWRINENYEAPPVVLELIKMKEQSGAVVMEQFLAQFRIAGKLCYAKTIDGLAPQ